MNAPKLNPLKRDWPKLTYDLSQYQYVTCYKPVQAWLSYSYICVFFKSFFRCVLLLNDTSYSKSVWRDK